jgi:hypothetical protein
VAARPSAELIAFADFASPFKSRCSGVSRERGGESGSHRPVTEGGEVRQRHVHGVILAKLIAHVAGQRDAR